MDTEADVWDAAVAAWGVRADDAPSAALLERARELTTVRWRAAYAVLAQAVFAACVAGQRKRPIVLGVAGAQGTGKSTFAAHLAALAEARGLRTAVLGLDDIYLSRVERETLARTVHPLLRTRGVPGTHDVALGLRLLSALTAHEDGELLLPVFDKGLDDRAPVAAWREVRTPLDLVVFEGWCVGLPPEPWPSLDTAVNALEFGEDADGRWRRYVNAALETPYARLFGVLDALVAFLPPDLEAVLRWRTEQESALPPERRMSSEALRRFVAHYARLTRHGIACYPRVADLVIRLGHGHDVAALERGRAERS